MARATSIRKGMTIIYNDEACVVLDFTHVTPGKGNAIVQTTLRSLKTGRSVKARFRPTENIEPAVLDSRRTQFLYHDNDGWHFMDLADYNTFTVSQEVVGDNGNYLSENLELEITFYEGAPVTIELPTTVTLKITESPPGVKGDSATTNTKPATLETGHSLQVPFFVNQGDSIVIDTRTGEYVTRA